MIDNDVLTSAADAALSIDYARVYRSGVVALFYADGIHRATTTLQGTADSEVVAVAGLAPALGADQMLWVSGAVYSPTMEAAGMDPHLTPALVYLAARRDLARAYYRRDLFVDDYGAMTARSPLERRDHSASRWAALVIVPWIMDQPEGDVDHWVETLGERGHRVTLV